MQGTFNFAIQGTCMHEEYSSINEGQTTQTDQFLDIAKTISQRQNPRMQTLTTKGATDLLYADYYSSNGCPDIWCLENESASIELEALRFRLR